MGAKILSEQEVQDLVRRQAAAFWLPRPNKKKAAGGACPTLPGQVEMRRFPPSIIPGLPGHQQGEVGQNGGTGSGPPEVCHAIRGSLQGDFMELSKTSISV